MVTAQKSPPSKWISGNEAADAIDRCNDAAGAIAELRVLLIQGKIGAECLGLSYAKTNGPDQIAEGGALSKALRRRIGNTIAHGGEWSRASVALPAAHNAAAVEVINFRLDREQFSDLLKRHGLPNLPVPNAAQQGRDAGGANSGEHGEPIARLVVDLLKRDPERVRALTGVAVAEDLRKKYQLAGQHPPCDRNLRRMANGILRGIGARPE